MAGSESMWSLLRPGWSLLGRIGGGWRRVEEIKDYIQIAKKACIVWMDGTEVGMAPRRVRAKYLVLLWPAPASRSGASCHGITRKWDHQKRVLTLGGGPLLPDAFH
jgi:hypothetical protein